MSILKKVSVITTARSDYGLLKWLMVELNNDANFELKIVATGSHLSPEHGETIKNIEEDGFEIAEKVDMLVSSVEPTSVGKSMGLALISITDVLNRLKPDFVIVLGDRYELLPICSAALVQNIPIVHISGGDITEGAIDDLVRHSVSKMASLHFPGNEESKKRLIQMGEFPDRVFNVGEPGLDNLKRLKVMSRDELTANLKLDGSLDWVLLTFHPETTLSDFENMALVENQIEFLKTLEGVQIVITYANADLCGFKINERWESLALEDPKRFVVIKNLGQLRYISFMREVIAVIGNSSSGIVETPSLKIPTINIGNRQKGRFTCENVLNITGTLDDLKGAWSDINSSSYKDGLKDYETPYGKGETAIEILNVLKGIDLSNLLKKGFYQK